MNRKLLDILACPVCKGKLVYNKTAKELICRADRLAYPIVEGIPEMLSERARKVSLEELKGLGSPR